MREIDGFSGSLLVTRGEAAIMQVAAGVADAESGEACTADTRFQIASVSKQFTAAAAMLLVEQRQLTLDAPIADWLIDCPAQWGCLTLHQLLSHTSGLGHWWGLPGFDVNLLGTADEFLDRFATVPLRSTPGSAWHYSSPGYLLAGRVIEEASGQRYGDFLTECVLQPLGLNSTTVGAPPCESAARGYRKGRRVDVAEFAAVPGAGDIWSTVGDLARYTSAFNADRVVTAGSRQAMVTAHSPMSDWGTDDPVIADGYGYGYCLGTLSGHPARFHPGDNPGYQSFLCWLPKLDVTIAILSNDEDTNISNVLKQLLPAALASR